MKKLAYDNIRFDTVKVVEDNKNYLKVQAVITKEGVYDYPDGRAFKCRKELLKAVPSAMNAKLTILEHPESMVIMSQDQIYGFIEKPFFDNDKIRATLAFDKKATPPDFLGKIRKGLMRDVSIGFYYQPEFKHGHWSGKTYDYIMRDIVIDHVAAGVLKGRCTFPSCGIGVDTYLRRIGHEHWGEYSSLEECVAANQDKGDPEAYCMSIHHAGDQGHKLNRGEKMTKKKQADYGHAKSPEEIEAEYQECVAGRIAMGHTQGEAEELCQASTKPSDEPTPVPGNTLDEEEQSPYQKCLAAKTEAGMTLEEAEAACKEDGAVKTDQDAAFENCVAREIEQGKTREEAEANCRGAHPIVEDAEPEATPLEVCIANQLEGGDKTEEEARAWCEAELAGEHEEATDMIERSQKLLRLRENQRIEKLRQSS